MCFFMVSEHPISNEKTIPMASSQNPTLGASSQNPNNQPMSPIETPLIALNITAQINCKLTSSTFSQWRAQFEALLIGYDLMDYVTGQSTCPPSNRTTYSASILNNWIRRDKLILIAILASTSTTME